MPTSLHPSASIAVAGLIGIAASVTPAKGQDPIAFFESRIRPVLVAHCYECHSAEAGRARGGLQLHSREAVLQGGDSGALIVAGNPGASLLMQALHHQDEDYAMPPEGKLPDHVVADFARWIEMGAPDPRTDAAPAYVETEIDLEAGREFWSFQGPVLVDPPPVEDGDWSRDPIDRFILAALEERGLSPASDASPEALLRRISFVITGLPPGPEQVAAFRRAHAVDPDAAIREEIERLLDSPGFGERFGQHWLDVARYADSTGGDSNNITPHAWRYREYVIDSFNRDKPFNRFIHEQIAGDLLPARTDAEWAENLIATGFLAVGQKLVGEVEDRKFAADLVDEQIDATSRAFLGMTIACARCHDHKSDPFSQTDYYSLAAIFRNTSTHYGLLPANARQSSSLIDVTGLGVPADRPTLSEGELAALIAGRDAAADNMGGLMSSIRSGGEKVTRANLRRSRTQRDEAMHALASYDDQGRPLVFIMGVQDRERELETRLLVRGELGKPGQVVQRNFPQVIGGRFDQDQPGSGRRQLAAWIASPRNPLTARVIANRVWGWCFGEGLVRSPDDFGAGGQAPTHPELLDHLALRLIHHDWSIKKLVSDILLTRTWQQSAAFNETAFAADPENLLLWRAHPRRLEAEAIRDAMLVAGGNLETTRPARPLLHIAGEGTVGLSVYEPVIRAIEANCRSIYVPRVRSVLPHGLEVFDTPDASNVIGRRETTTVPLQALYTMNGDFPRRQAEGFAARLAGLETDARITRAHLIAFGREPTPAERRLAVEFLGRYDLTTYCHALICTAEFTLID